MGIVYVFLLAQCFFLSMISIALNTTNQVNESMALLIIFLNIFVVLLALYKEADGNKKLITILIFSFGIRVLLLLLDRYGYKYFILPGAGGDTQLFHLEALNFPNIKFLDNPYSYIVGIIYSLCEEQRIIAQYFNVLLSISTIIVTLKILDEFEISNKIKYIIISILSFIPNYMILSVLLLRESIMIFLVALSLLKFIRWWKYNGALNYINSIVFILLAAILHSGVIANAIGYIIIFILCNNRKREFKLNLKSISRIFIFLIIFIVFYGQFSQIFLSKFGTIEDINDITYRTSVAEAGGSAYNVGGDVNSIGDLIKNSPIRMFYFIASPLPWDWRGLNDVISFVFSAMFYFIIYIYAIKSIRLPIKNNIKKAIKSLIIISLIGAFVFAWGTSNAGTAMRHRDKFIVNYVVMLALALEIIRKYSIKNNNSKINIEEIQYGQ